MRFLTFLKITVLALLLSFSVKQAEATHLYGSDFTYQYIGPSGNPANPFRYKLNYQIYFGNNAGNMVNFKWFRKNGTLIGSIFQTPVSTSAPIPLSTSLGCGVSGNLPTIRLWQYQLTIDLPLTFDGYYATAEISARNNDINNLLNPGGAALFSYIEIPTCLMPSAGPVYTDTAMFLMYSNDTTSVNYTATDADGDTLVYLFQQPFSGSGPAPFIPSAAIPQRADYANSGYSLSQPFGPGSFATISNSGNAKFFAPNPGNYVVSVQVKEFRSVNGVDVLIGTSMRDIQILVRNNPSQFNAIPSIALSGQFSAPFEITVHEGEAIAPLTITFTDPNPGQLLAIKLNSPLLDGNGPFNANFNGNPGSVNLANQQIGTTGTFNYISKGGEAGMYPLNITVNDNQCPPGKAVVPLVIRVNPYRKPQTFTGDTTVVANTTPKLYSIPNKPGAIYSWNLQGGGTIVSGKLTNAVTINWTTAGRYKLTATESAGSCCTDSLSFYVNVAGSPVGLNENFINTEANRKISVVPNPVQKSESVLLTLNKALTAKGEVYIYDVRGKLVMQQAISKGRDDYSLPLNKLKTGLYLISVESGNMISKTKLVIQ